MAHSTTSAMEPVALRLKASPDLPVILYSPRICARLQPCKEERKEYVPDCSPANQKGKESVCLSATIMGSAIICARLQACKANRGRKVYTMMGSAMICARLQPCRRGICLVTRLMGEVRDSIEELLQTDCLVPARYDIALTLTREGKPCHLYVAALPDLGTYTHATVCCSLKQLLGNREQTGSQCADIVFSLPV